MTQKIAINTDFGGFGLSDQAINLYKILTGIPPAEDVYYWEIARNNPQLIQIVEQLGKNANTRYSTLKIVEIPDDVEWQISEYDGVEWVAEKHRTWQ
jgi:hypothetical protein